MKFALILFLCLAHATVSAQAIDSTDCSMIEREYDEFDKKTSYYTPIEKDCYLVKIIENKATYYYLRLHAPGNIATVGDKGVKIILSNGQILSFPSEKIKVDVKNGGYDYSAFITVTPKVLDLLKKHRIQKWKLYIFDNSHTEHEAESFTKAVNCIVKRNNP